MQRNLNTTKYSDGTPIPFYSKDQNAEFANLGNNDTDKGFGYYDEVGNAAGEIYGALYTYAAATNGNNSGTDVQGACPTGWHIPSDAEWTTLTDELGGTNQASQLAGNAALWNDGALENDVDFGISGFSALSGGYRNINSGTFNILGNYGYWWSATQYDSWSTWHRWIRYSNSQVVGRSDNNKSNGFSVRCVRD